MNYIIIIISVLVSIVFFLRSRYLLNKVDILQSELKRQAGFFERETKDFEKLKERLNDQLQSNIDLIDKVALQESKFSKSKKSQCSNLKGKIAEKFIKVSDDLPYNPYDFFPQAPPLDFIVLDGYSNPKKEISIIFAEVKTGNAILNPNEERVKNAIQHGRVRYETIRVKSTFTATKEEEVPL